MNIAPQRSVRCRVIMGVMLTASVFALAACSGAPESADAGDGTGTITVWAHQGQDSENAVLEDAVTTFNSSQSKITAKLTLIAEATYTKTVSSTPIDQLPDVLDMDGPTLANYAYNGKLSPLKSFVSDSTISNATAGSISEGTYDKDLYGLAMFDAGLGLYGNKKLLDAAGVSYPTGLDDAWSAEEFAADLAKLAAASPTGKALDISEQAGLGTEWGTFAFSPTIWSAGGNLMSDGKALGTLDSAASVSALESFASWKQYVDSNADGNAFIDARVALGWSGHWNYPAYSEALGSDLVIMPLPDFGSGPKTGAGSWTWGIGGSTKNGLAAGAFLDYLLNDSNVTAMTTANGAPPATTTALAADSNYSAGGPLALFGEQLTNTCGTGPITDSCTSVYRPTTPGYPVITSQFASALAAIYGGADAQSALTKAATAIDRDFSDNNGYK